MRRLYWQVYVAFIGILMLFGMSLGAALFFFSSADGGYWLDGAAAIARELLPGPDAPDADVAAVLTRLQEPLDISASVWDPSGRERASVGEPLPRPGASWEMSRVVHSRRPGFTLALALGDGGWVVVRHHRDHGPPFRGLGVLLLLAGAVAVGAYPLVRRLTGRVERLQTRVDALARGELGARVEVEGEDEVAELAKSFNLAAERIERLVEAQKTLMAGASHELRSPLTRIRMATALFPDDVRPELRQCIERDIEELDELLGELLLASRLDTIDAIEAAEPVDLLALAEEESARYGASVSGEPVTVSGDLRLLRRLMRNLLGNAHRYAADGPIEVAVGETGGRATVRVLDRGPGVPADEQEHIFEPFYRGHTAGSEDGVGLGLSLVRRIAALHGGTATHRMRDGGGSVFEVVL